MREETGEFFLKLELGLGFPQGWATLSRWCPQAFLLFFVRSRSLARPLARLVCRLRGRLPSYPNTVRPGRLGDGVPPTENEGEVSHAERSTIVEAHVKTPSVANAQSSGYTSSSVPQVWFVGNGNKMENRIRLLFGGG